jgi:hypothetical protein
MVSLDNKDDIFDLLSLLKEHQAMEGGGFLGEVLISSTLCAVLALKKQLDIIVTFCCQPSNFSVFGIDATFELGDFYVTLTTYRNFYLIVLTPVIHQFYWDQRSFIWTGSVTNIIHSFLVFLNLHLRLVR